MTMIHDGRAGVRAWGVLLLLLAASAVAGTIGSAVTLPSIPDWYAGLAKPAWTPPDAVFGPVWTVLYLLMVVAAWLVWRSAGWRRARGALTLHAVQLGLNALWSVLFFGLHRTGFALVEILALWAVILATIIAFRRHSPAAAWLMAPYLLWVSYAVSLNAGVWWLNG
ncbi:MAG TPA: TspO/MBR family protein, partial [Alphaproteobacteria bacterium]|nr:TspO/MBR family protein [Alphaproteobacteria bacterium]